MIKKKRKYKKDSRICSAFEQNLIIEKEYVNGIKLWKKGGRIYQ